MCIDLKIENYIDLKMPSSKYYRTILNQDVLNMIGDYAGSFYNVLRFPLTKKRKFIGTVMVKCMDTQNVKKLKTKHWNKITLGDDMQLNLIHRILWSRISYPWSGYRCYSHLKEGLSDIHKVLTQTLDYELT